MKEDTNYDAIYLETASKTLLRARQQQAKIDMHLDRVCRNLYMVILHHLQKTEIHNSDTKLDLSVQPSFDYDMINLLVGVTSKTADGVNLLADHHFIYIKTDAEHVAKTSVDALKNKEWFPREYPFDQLLLKLASIRRLVDEYDEIVHEYINLENAHLKQFSCYAHKRIEQEKVHRRWQSYTFLTALDSFCTPDEDGFVSGQTMVLVKRDWNNLQTPDFLRGTILALQTCPSPHERKELRENLENSLFLKCKIGSYYPLSFEQLWDQMIVGMNLDRE